MSNEEDLDLGDLMSILAEDLQVVIARTLADRSPEPARLFGARVAATDRRVAAEARLPEDRHETLGATVGCLILTEWLAGARVHDELDLAGMLGSIHADLGPDCADLARDATALLDGPAQPPDEDLLVALIWLAAAVVRHYGNDDVAWLCGSPADSR
ncbi:hypothetical protein [Saccharopolyspora sp. NPDC049426]|uniref:hypothetical protein n=1 Tax=Saccharopolyspora sp. NPDC049426 TaxID=3155652 RepID=UPI0034230B39